MAKRQKDLKQGSLAPTKIQGLSTDQKYAKSTKDPDKAIWARIILVAALAFVIIVPVYSLSQSLEARSLAESKQSGNVNLIEPTKSEAFHGLYEWLLANPAPIPSGFVQSWDGVIEGQAPTVDPTDETRITPGYQVHQFTIGVSKSSRIYTVDVQVAYDDINGAKIMGTPSIVPLPPSSLDINEVNPWPNMVDAAIPAPVSSAASAWMDAFASGDPSRLLLYTGDPDSNHSYLPLSGVAYYGNMALSQSTIVEIDGKKYQLARASFGLTWAANPEKTKPTNVADEKDDEKKGASLSPVSYDLLIDRYDTASPVIVAWGGPGTGTTLKPYSNAIAGRDISVGGTDSSDNNGVQPSGQAESSDAASNGASTEPNQNKN